MQLMLSFGVLFSFVCLTLEYHTKFGLTNRVTNNTASLPLEGITGRNYVKISCNCNGRNLQKYFPIIITLKKDLSKHCEKKTTSISNFFNQCDNCTFEIQIDSWLPPVEKNDFPCLHQFIRRLYSERQIQKTKISGSSRIRRELYLTENCLFPSELRTAELKCHIHSKFVKCRQSCLFGYTLEEGISREMKCYYKDNKWSGPGFKECVPFVDCTLKLVSGGKMTCQKNTVWAAPYCDVSCEAYEDKPAVPMKRYICTTEPHKWSSDLPHCVLPGSGFELAPAPRIKDHAKEVLEPETNYKKAQIAKVTTSNILKRNSVMVGDNIGQEDEDNYEEDTYEEEEDS